VPDDIGSPLLRESSSFSGEHLFRKEKREKKVEEGTPERLEAGVRRSTSSARSSSFQLFREERKGGEKERNRASSPRTASYFGL